MIPSPLVLLVVVLAAYRLTRLIGWDDLPPIVRARMWLVGAEQKVTGSANAVAGLTTEQPQVVWTYRRPLLAHFLACAFCQGFWTSCAAYAAWATLGRWSLYALVPLAVSGAVGLIAKNLDP
jgi:hypothetical protein